MARKRAKSLLFAVRLLVLLVYVGQCLGAATGDFLIRSVQVKLNDSGTDLSGFIVYGNGSTTPVDPHAPAATIIQTLSLARGMKKDDYLEEVVPEHLAAYCSAVANKMNQAVALSSDEAARKRFANDNCYLRIERLDLSYNELVHFPSGVLRDWFFNLKQLNLSMNAIEALNSTVDFWPMLGRETLHTLDLSFNRIKSIELDTFKYLNSLRHLNLANNQISKIDLFAFTTDTQFLVELDLSNNLINDQSMEFLLFASLTNLKVLNMKNNRLTTLSHHLLFNLYNLEYLSLANNHLKSFDIFRLNKNNEMLRFIDLSSNWNLRFEVPSKSHRKERNRKKAESGVDEFDDRSEEAADHDYSHETNSVEVLNLASIDMSHLNMSVFLDHLLDRYKALRSLNMSSCKLRNMTSRKWPRTIETVDLSGNLIRDFDCQQFPGLFSPGHAHLSSRMKLLSLNGNRLGNFKSLMLSCSSMFNKYRKHHFMMDLRNNLFEGLDSLSTIEESSAATKQCHEQSNMNNLLLAGNPIVCDCDEHNWWANIGTGVSSLSPFTFAVNKEFCLSVGDYEKLSCTSVSILEQVKYAKLYQKSSEGGEEESPGPASPVEGSEEVEYHQTREILLNLTSSSPSSVYFPSLATPTIFRFDTIRQHLIAPSLICPYKYSCSAKTCECCGFRACDCSFHCPNVCHCARDYAHTFDLVNCTKVSLNFIPNYLPTSTTELLLDGNNLKRIQPYQFFGRFRLTRLDLSHNMLAFIEENSFHGLTSLKVLKLSHNHLQILLGYEFKDLHQLEHLHLDNNQIQFISNATFASLVNLKYLYLMNNNLRHYLEHNVYFQFNAHLINLSIEYAKNLEGHRNEQIEMIVESNKNRTAEVWTLNGKGSLDARADKKSKNKTIGSYGVKVLSNHNYSRKSNRKFEMRSSIVNGQPVKQLVFKPSQNRSKADESWDDDAESTLVSKNAKSAERPPITYLELFKNLTKSRKLSDKLGADFYDCILSRFKETVLYPSESSNETTPHDVLLNLNGTDDVQMAVNQTIGLDVLVPAPEFRILIAKNFKKYRMICNKLLNKKNRTEAGSHEVADNESQEVLYPGEFKYGNTDLAPLKALSSGEEAGSKGDDYSDQYYNNMEDLASTNRFSVDDDHSALNSPEFIANQKQLSKEGGRTGSGSSSFIVVNYTTIIWYTFLLVVGALLFSVILAMFITRFQSRKKAGRKADLGQSGPLKASKTNRRPHQVCPYQVRRLFVSFRKHFFRVMTTDSASDSQQHQLDSQNTSNDTISSSHNSSGSNYDADHKDAGPAVTMLGMNMYEYKKCSDELPNYEEYAKVKETKPKMPLMRNSVSNNTINMNNYSSLSKLIKMKELPETTDQSSSSSYNLKADGAAEGIYGKSRRSKFDLFIVYNKLDSEYVCDVITPILKGKPYFFTVALQHHLDEKLAAEKQRILVPAMQHIPAIKATTTFTADAITTKTIRGHLTRSSSSQQRSRQKMSMINLNNNNYFYEQPSSMCSSTTDSSTSPLTYIPPVLTSSANSLHRSRPALYSNHKVGGKKHSTLASTYSIARIEHLVEYVKTSSLVIFVLSKNLFTETEYRLALQTPKSKKIAILADDICESIAEKILKPKKIIKGSFSGSSEWMSPLNFESSSSASSAQHNNNEYIELNEEYLGLTTDDSTTIDSGTATAVTISSSTDGEGSPYHQGLDSLLHQSLVNTHLHRPIKRAQINAKKAKRPSSTNQNTLDI